MTQGIKHERLAPRSFVPSFGVSTAICSSVCCGCDLVSFGPSSSVNNKKEFKEEMWMKAGKQYFLKQK